MFCFNEIMEVSVNQHLKNPPPNVGVIIPPDGYNKPKIYSHSKATRDFGKINQDIYEGEKKAKKRDERKTPKSVLILLGLSAATAAFMLLKKVFHRR